MATTADTIKFVIGTHGLNTSIDEFYTWEEWTAASNEDLPANTSWDIVEVASEDDMNAFLAAKNRYLEAAWTPNQTPEDREEYGVKCATVTYGVR